MSFKLSHHDLEWLQREKPDDLRQVRDYSRITRQMLPKLLATVRETIAELNRFPDTRVAFAHVFHPFLGEQVGALNGDSRLTTARYAVVTVKSSQVTARSYSGISQEVWRTLELAKLLAS